MGKLTQLGCQNGMPPFDDRTQPFRDFLTQTAKEPRSATGKWTPFRRLIVGTFLTVAGYHHDDAVQNYVRRRLNTLYQFTKKNDYALYVDRDAYPDIPQGFRDKQLINPLLSAGGEMPLPRIYDVHALAHFPEVLHDGATQRRIDTVIDYVLHPSYQVLPDGYGIMRAGKRRYYAKGWSVHLPRYRDVHENPMRINRFVQRVVLMAHFRTAREHAWFRAAVAHLETYRTEQGTYLFPRHYLQERQRGYWVTGVYMGLEANRRPQRVLEMESTFWMMKVKQLSDMHRSRNCE
jgi:hypothetical protein